MENKIRKIIKEQIKKLSEMKVTDKDGKDVTSDMIKKIEKSLEKAGYKFTKGYTSDPDLRKDDPRYTKAEGEEEFTPDLEKDDLQRKAIKQMMDREKKKPNLKSMADIDKSDWTPDGGGGSIGYMEYEDGTEMTPQEIQDYFEVNHELYDDIMQGLYETNDPEDDEEQEEYDKGWYGESLKSLAEALGYLKEEFTSAEQFFDKMSDEEKKKVTSKWIVGGADENIIKSYKEVLNWLRTYVKQTKDLPSDESQKVLDQTIMDYVKEK
jgi:hypothetical protein